MTGDAVVCAAAPLTAAAGTPVPAAAPPRRVVVIYGSEPEAVQAAPLIRALARSRLFTPLTSPGAGPGYRGSP